MPDNPSVDMLKKMKLDVSSTELPKPSAGSDLDTGQAPPRHSTTVEEVEDVDMKQAFAPGGDADYFVEEDEEGRFFGGGLTSEQKDILNIFENAGEEEGVQGDVCTRCFGATIFNLVLNPDPVSPMNYPSLPFDECS